MNEDELVLYLLNKGKNIEQDVKFKNDPYKDTGINIFDLIKEDKEDEV